MRIGVDYTPAYEQGGGIGRYVRELMRALSQLDDSPLVDVELRLFVSGVRAKPLPSIPSANWLWCGTRWAPRDLARLWHRARAPLPVEFFTGRLDLYHATDFVLPPTRANTATLLTVHDLSFVRVPDAASPSLRTYLNAVVPRSVHRADRILADSQATKDDLVVLYGVPAGKVTVLLSGVDVRFVPANESVKMTTRSKYGIARRPYLFSIGTVQPRKNYGRLAQALRLLIDRGFDLDLVIAGGKGWLEDPIYDTIRDSGVQDHVHFIGFAGENDLPALYSGAEALVFPSLYEGFGLPILEAMACHTPVVTSTVSSMPEVADDAALCVDPYSVEAIADAVQRILDDSALRQTLVTRGRERAAAFTWERAARQLAQVYADLLQGI